MTSINTHFYGYNLNVNLEVSSIKTNLLSNSTVASDKNIVFIFPIETYVITLSCGSGHYRFIIDIFSRESCKEHSYHVTIFHHTCDFINENL